MPRYIGQAPHRHGSDAPAAVLLVNLGTPEGPGKRAVRRYLAEFLSDPRIVELPRALWKPILHGVILRIRPARSSALYAKVWTPEGSPLQTGMAALATKLQSALKAQRAGPILVRHAMRYGKPAVGDTLRELAAAGVRRVMVVPLFPQYSGTTTASVFDAVGAELSRWRWVPELRFVADYHAEARYIEALARSVETYWQRHGRGERLVLSYHGIPEKYFRAGDPYFCQCQATARRLRERLDLREDEMIVAFQSRVGRQSWLKPYTEEVLQSLPADGVKHVQVLCPGFSVDCLETLEEIALTNHARFLRAGGERFDYIPALNAGDDHVAALTDLVLRQGQGWPEFDPAWDAARASAQQMAARTRYEQLRDGRPR
ncbi:ferrochelatase [Dokdonella sp.]|uniref:ferrochelatase n=1 Tax=Dokdonella sp. TaxID=2291710 RepID=UPI00260901B4|nr:ferrochelatase [Dokdonella sp.]